MRHVRDVIRLKSAGMRTREIARRLGTAPLALTSAEITTRGFSRSGFGTGRPISGSQ